jgi:hypothetical protein
MVLPKKSAQASPATSPHIRKLDNLITAKQASIAPKDGRLELALAIAATTKLVIVDPTTTPFTTTPDDLFDLTFVDAAVGIDDDQMPVLKASLSVLLADISDDISEIPENAALPIEKVAEFVRLSLLAKSQ